MNGEPSSVATLELADFPGHLADQLHSVVEAAKILGLSTNWIYQRTRKDAIPFHKFGKYIRFTNSDLAEILTAFSRGPKKFGRDPSRGGRMTEHQEEQAIRVNRSWSISYRAADGRRLSESGFSSRAEAIARLQEILLQIDQTGRVEPETLGRER